MAPDKICLDKFCICHYISDHMEESKSELVQIRVDKDLKAEFFRLASKRGETPSTLLRGLMQQAIEREAGRIKELEESQKSLVTILLEVVSFIQKDAMGSSNDERWRRYRDSFLPEYLDELVGDSLRNEERTDESYWRRYWKEIDENWSTRFQDNPPILSVHLRRDVMDAARDARLGRKPGN
jgi:antitoxin component of RelBE/YafQ-DinJ toxin-antitoxin module